KLAELKLLATALNQGRDTVADALAENAAAIESRRRSPRVHNPAVKAAVARIDARLGNRASAYPQRAAAQSARLKLPLFPTPDGMSLDDYLVQLSKEGLEKRLEQLFPDTAER
ncbi:hypothetical protein SB751_28865, partial [Cupriavidus sp. SIMBA_020]